MPKAIDIEDIGRTIQKLIVILFFGFYRQFFHSSLLVLFNGY